tara:strand:- start:42 stop:275 length:234 start_codon:yes stop_codon:yes gene_type:complete
MKEITEKQALEWKAELTVQKQKKLQAEQALDEANRTILMIEGGIQFAQIALKKHESSDLPKDTVDLMPKSKKAQPNS